MPSTRRLGDLMGAEKWIRRLVVRPFKVLPILSEVKAAHHTELCLCFKVYKPVSDSVTVAIISTGPGEDRYMYSEGPSEKSITFFISSSLKEKFADPFICFVKKIFNFIL